ncbi:MAG: DNA internalization-related competence protein ComEC/Rec2 [Bacteroidota bacterium]
MNRRPALIAALVMSGGIISAQSLNLSWHLTAITAVLFFLLSLFVLLRSSGKNGRDNLPSFFFLFALFFSSASFYSIKEQNPESDDIRRYLHISDSLSVTCRVIDEPRMKDGKIKMLVSVRSLANEFDTIEVIGKAYVTILPNKRVKETPPRITYGSVLSFRGLLQLPGNERNPGEFSYRDYLALNNIFAVTSVLGYSQVTIHGERDPHWFFEYGIYPSKDFIVRTIMTVMKGDEANFLIGLLLGDRTEISEEIKKAFMNTGTIHVLAVSGSHVILVVTIAYVVLGLMRFPGKIKIVLTLIALIYYTFLTGAAPSIVRASIMAGIVLVGKFFQQKTDSYNVLGLSAVLIYLYDPKQLFDVGFQLSFSAVFSMVYFYPKLNAMIKKIPEPLEEFRIITPLWQLFALSLAAQIGTIPFTAYYFGKISIVSLFANLLVVPIVGLIVTIGLTGALLGTISMWIAAMFSEVNDLLARFTLIFVKLAEQVPFALIDTATFGWKETALYSAVIAYLVNLRNVIVRKRIMFAVLTGANFFVYSAMTEPLNPALRVTFLDVGQGDGAVIRFPSGETYVIDGGPISAGYDAGERIVGPYLRRNGIRRVDAIVTTHPHADHLGGVPYLMRNFDVGSTIDAGQRLSSKLFRDYDSLESGVSRITARAGTIASIGNARIYYLHPTHRFIDDDSSDGYSDINESSVVFKLQYGTTTFLFTGDAEAESEHHLISVYGDFLNADVLKAGHHGSSTSSTEDFVSIVAPDHAVVSVAKFNKFRHPSRTVIERLRRSGASVYRTDMEGAIILESDGTTVRKRQWRED